MINKSSKLGLVLLAFCFVVTSGSAQTFTLLTQRDNFADVQGNPVPSGTLFGIVVDSNGEGFAVDGFGPFLTALNGNDRPDSFLTLTDGSQSSSGLIFVGSMGGNGYIGGAMDIRHVDGSGIAGTGQQWGIIWFPGITNGKTPGAGDSYGFYTNENLTIPSAGSTASYHEFISADLKTADFTIIPEPATYTAILGFGVLLFVFLRRRFRG